jgi:twitching motility two-component system response regulator PilH
MIRGRTILCIEEANTFLNIFGSYFEDRGYCVLRATSVKDGLELLAAKGVDAVVLDYQMSGMSGVAALQVVKRVSSETPVLVLSRAKSTVPQDVRHAATAVLLKDRSTSELVRSVERSLEVKLQKN